MFDKILIANRGEIACRVIKTARKMGIKTVAVYSDADAAALHVEMADEAVRLGPPPAAESYLLGDRIVEACLKTGAQAVHPGYGFLSEREWFASALAKENIAFIGPPPKAIAAMGDKIESKKLAQAAGVSVVPGFIGEITDTEHAVRIAGEIGYPVMMKASAGGGGKGMRLAWNERDVRDGFQSTRNEGKASFGDDRVFIEKFVEQPRHIEIQLIGDQHGNTVYLNERDCSIQRRHQKVVEEAPSPFVTPDMRRAMGEQAVALAKGVGYFSAGTVEFIAGADRSFYFLEMNTRLQVEHPVTEMITGLDLVECMIRVAAGEPLGFTQKDVRLDGWAIETRVYAEDPYRGFLPSIGRLSRCAPPTEGDGVRVDTGVVEGAEISMFYDPMIAKLITHGATRAEAIEKQTIALDRYLVRGVGNNIDFVSAVMQHPRFQAGAEVTTAFIAEEYPDGFHGAPATPETIQGLVAAAAVINAVDTERAQLIDGQLNGYGAQYGEDWVVQLGGENHPVSVLAAGDSYDVALGGVTLRLTTEWRVGEPLFEAHIEDEDGNRRGIVIAIDRLATGLRLTTRGAAHTARVLTPRSAALAAHMIAKVAPDMSRYLLCPMPGLVMALGVKPGDKVEAGQALATVEAMKMENILRAEKSATIKEVRAQVGESLAVDAVILEFEV
ncbi:MAG: acetyl-CoA carboxylase biotin carboxylase subunit [Polymorphobacter sp.]